MAIVSGVYAKINAHTVTIGSDRFASFDADYRMTIVDALAKQAPMEILRPLGLNDNQIPEAISTVFSVKPVHFCAKAALRQCFDPTLR